MLQYAEQLRNTLILIQAFYSAVLLLLSKDALSHCVFNFQGFFFKFLCNVYEFLFESSSAYCYGKRFVQLFYYLIFCSRSRPSGRSENLEVKNKLKAF